ncbi:hypothetical protein LJK88_45015 [Paenibacillus sp. P26]|nr:hypothetical protein LJK88_45015 [Paenibacillus sp. P26]
MPAWLNKKNAVKMRGTVSLIGEGSFFKGDMSSQADVRVEGEFHGVLHASGKSPSASGAACAPPICRPAR